MIGTDEDDLCGLVGVNMRVDAFGDWIESAAGEEIFRQSDPSGIVDDEPPAIAFKSIEDGDSINGVDQVELLVTDNEGLAYVTLAIDGVWQDEQRSGPYLFAIDGPHDQSVTLRGRAVDTYGNAQELDVTLTASDGATSTPDQQGSGSVVVNAGGGAGGGTFQPLEGSGGCQTVSHLPSNGLCILFLLAAVLRRTVAKSESQKSRP